MWSYKILFLVATQLLLRVVRAGAGGILLVAEFNAAAVRDREVLETHLLDISKTTAKNDDISIYGIFSPQVGDGKTLFTVEKYANQAALDAHLESTGVQDLFAFLDTIHVTPIVSLLDIEDELSFNKPLPSDVNPWILLQEITYNTETAIQKLMPAWKNVVDAARKESGTFAFGAYPDPKNATKLFTFEVYQSFDFFSGTHARGDALAEKNRQAGNLVASLKGAELRLVGGFLHKN